MGELIFFVNNSCDYILNWAPLRQLLLLIILYPPPPPPPLDTGSLCYVKHIITSQFLLCIVAVNAYGNLMKSLILEITLYAS